jgi:hypothetical protein
MGQLRKLKGDFKRFHWTLILQKKTIKYRYNDKTVDKYVFNIYFLKTRLRQH